MIKNPKILIIDDIQDNIYAIRALLKKNFSSSIILTALNGDLGIDTLVRVVDLCCFHFQRAWLV